MTGERFSRIPPDLAAADLPAGAFRVMIALCQHVDAKGRAFPSQETLRDLTGLSLKTTKKWLARLEQAGWIDRHQVRHESTQQYRRSSYMVHSTPKRCHGSDEDVFPVAPPRGAVSVAPPRGANNSPSEQPIYEQPIYEQPSLYPTGMHFGKCTPCMEADFGQHDGKGCPDKPSTKRQDGPSRGDLYRPPAGGSALSADAAMALLERRMQAGEPIDGDAWGRLA